MHLSFKYFELEDIVPTAIRIFNEVGLIPPQPLPEWVRERAQSSQTGG